MLFQFTTGTWVGKVSHDAIPCVYVPVCPDQLHEGGTRVKKERQKRILLSLLLAVNSLPCSQCM